MQTKIRVNMDTYTMHFIGWTLKKAAISAAVGWGVLGVGIIGLMQLLGSAMSVPAWLSLCFILGVAVAEGVIWGIAFIKLRDVINPALHFYTDGKDD